MQIQVDTREKAKEWERIRKQFDAMGVKYFRSKLFVGDYMSLDNPRLVIDRKKGLTELCGNVTQQHERFRAELIRAKEQGIKIIILVEGEKGITCLEDVMFWKNPRLAKTDIRIVNGRPKKIQLYPKATTGQQLFKSLWTIHNRYDVDFYFCDKKNTGRTIFELLRG